MIPGSGSLRSIARHALPAGLGQRLLLAILSINLVLSLLATSAQLYASYQRDAAQVFRIIDTIGRSFRDGFTNALWEYNFELVEALLEGVHDKTDVHHVALSTPAGRQWARGTQVPDPSNEYRLSFAYAAAGAQPQAIGQLTIGLSLDNVRARVWSQFWVLLASNFAKSVVASIAMLLLFCHLVTRHLRRIAAHVAQRDWMGQDERLVLERGPAGEGDEIELIVSAINGSRERAASDYRRTVAAERLATERADELDRANRMLAETNREQAEFTQALAHDVKGPLDSVAMLLQEFVEDEAQQEPEAQHLLTLAQRTNARMRGLVDDVLAYSSAIGTPPALERIDLAGLVEDVIDDLRADIVRSGALITVGELPDVSGSPCHVRTLVQNLVSNAMKFRSPERPPRIEVRAVPDDGPGFVRLVVSDNGIGIDAEHQGAVFGLFQRLHGHDAYPGSGVGLALCKRVVENQGGSIDLESTPDVGTTITSSLRRAA